MYINVKFYINFLKTHKMTQNQFLVCFLLHSKQSKLLIDLKNSIGFQLTAAEKADLLARDYLIEVRGMYRVTEKFSGEFLDKYTAANEAWDAYPSFMISNGMTFPLKNMPRTEFADAYFNAHKGVVDEHREILADINYGKLHGLIKVKLMNFMQAETWKDLRQLRYENEGETNNSPTKPDRNEF